MPNPPLAQGERLAWSSLPGHITAAIEKFLGSPVTLISSKPGGFSPGVAAVVQTTDGKNVFVKAVSSCPSAAAAESHRREILVNRSFPTDLQLPIPRLLWSFDEGDDGWVVLVFEAVDGSELAQPWDRGELGLVSDSLNALARRLTPSPIGKSVVGTASLWDVVTTNHWRQRDNEADRLRLDAWTQRNLEQLAALSDNAGMAVAGETLIHCDLRADNMVLSHDQVFIVDWPHARIGAAWLDPLFMGPSVTMHGGGDPEEFLRQSTVDQQLQHEHVNAALAAVAGFFTSSSLDPEPQGLRGLRAFQRAQGDVARTWLAARTGWR